MSYSGLESSSNKKILNELYYLIQWQRSIKTCFSNVHVNLSIKEIPLQEFDLAVELPENVNEKLILTTFQGLYDLIYKLSDSGQENSIIYNIYSECVEESFSKMVELLSETLNKSKKMLCLQVAIKLIKYWQNIEQNVLPFLTRVLMHVEWQQQMNTPNMLLRELTAKLFVQTILDNKSFKNVSVYVTKVIISCIIKKCTEINQYLLENNSLNYSHINEFERLLFLLKDDQMQVCISMIQMLISLGYNCEAIYYKLFEIPFLQRDYPKFLSKLSQESLTKSKPILHYIEFISKYFQLQSSFFSWLNFPKESIENMYKFSIYFLLTRNFKHLIYDEENYGFKQLMDERMYKSMEQFYSIIDDHYRKIITMSNKSAFQSANVLLINEFKLFIHQYLNNRLNKFSSTYYCRNRNEAIEFVEQLIIERDHWFLVCENIFKNEKDFHHSIQNYFYNLLKINEHVGQSLAYFIHELLSNNSDLSKKYQKINGRSGQFELLNKLFIIIVYVKDINQFYDFTKHYFTVRLLNQSSLLFTENELEQLDKMNSFIKINYLDNEFKHLMQNFHDFHNIYKDYLNSHHYFSNVFTKKKSSYGYLLKKICIFHAGLWKLTDFEQCWVPLRLHRSFKEFEKYYCKDHKHRKLLVNTKYSLAHVVYKLSHNKELKLIMNLNQFAILNQFNKENKVNYKMLFQRTNFQNDLNLRNALLSLIYCGLIHCSRIGSNIDNFIFEINENVFEKLIKNEIVSKELFIYEQINFLKHKPLDWNITNEQFHTIVQVLSSDQDLSFKLSAISVEDFNLNNILSYKSELNSNYKISRKKTKKSLPENNRKSGKNGALQTNTDTSSISTISSENNSSISTCEKLKNENKIGPNKQLQQLPADQSLILIEAAIVRIMKRFKYLPDLLTVYKWVQIEIKIRRFKLVKCLSTQSLYCINENDISLENVEFALARLIEKKYVNRDNHEGFVYIID